MLKSTITSPHRPSTRAERGGARETALRSKSAARLSAIPWMSRSGEKPGPWPCCFINPTTVWGPLDS